MILQALNRYYELLLKDPKSGIAPPGYSTISISYALNLSAEGDLLDVLPLFERSKDGRWENPTRMIVPEQVKRTGINPLPNFLWDNAAFMLGISGNDTKKPEYSLRRFQAFRQFNRDLLSDIDCEPAQAVVQFLDRYDPKTGREHPAILPILESLIKDGGNLVFRYQESFVHEDVSIRQAWDKHYAGRDAQMGQCLVTGEIEPIARLHPSIKGVKDANTMGASLVGFNERAYESYNRVKGQGLNSPVGIKAAFGYTTALNYLLSSANPNKKFNIGDTTVVYWAESEQPGYASAFEILLDPTYLEEQEEGVQGERKKAEERMKDTAIKIQKTQALDISKLTEGLDERTRFYVLGLAPNVARISVRFFMSDPFGKMVERIMQHYRDLEIVKEFTDQPDYLTIRRLLDETVSKKSSDKAAAPLMAGAVFRSILNGDPYPSALYYAIINRVHADADDTKAGVHKINYARAAIIKAYLIRKYRYQIQKPFQEDLQMLDEKATNPAYLLGRLFAVLEKAQQEAIGDMNASIKDRYFTSACATPATVFPILLRLSQHHTSKAEYGRTSDRRIEEILNLIDLEKNPIPARLSLDEQGIFILGYYHQRAAFYVSKKDKAQVEQPSQE